MIEFPSFKTPDKRWIMSNARTDPAFIKEIKICLDKRAHFSETHTVGFYPTHLPSLIMNPTKPQKGKIADDTKKIKNKEYHVDRVYHTDVEKTWEEVKQIVYDYAKKNKYVMPDCQCATFVIYVATELGVKFTKKNIGKRNIKEGDKIIPNVLYPGALGEDLVKHERGRRKP